MVEIDAEIPFRAWTALKVPAPVETRLNLPVHSQGFVVKRLEPTNQSRSFSQIRSRPAYELIQRQILLSSLNLRQILFRSIFDSRSRKNVGLSQRRSLYGGSRNAIWWYRENGVALWNACFVVVNDGLCHEVCSKLL